MSINRMLSAFTVILLVVCGALSLGLNHYRDNAICNQVNHLIPTRVLVKGGEITCKILK
nr:hypothetical protein [Escherichia coli]